LARELNDLVVGVSGLPDDMVRPRWQPEAPLVPKASENWAAIGVVRFNGERGGPELRHYSDDPGYSVLTQFDYPVVATTFYGPDCEGYARQFKDGLSIAQNWEQAYARGLNLYEMADILLFGELINNVWYRRAELELTFRQTVARRYEIQNILRAQGTMELQTWDGYLVPNDFDTDLVQQP